MLSYKVQSSKYRESVKTVKISITNTQLTLNRVMYTTYVWIMSKTAACFSDWQLLQINTLQNRRSTKLHFTATNKLRCGLNILPNRFKIITNRIDANWLKLTKETYKQKCKKEFITAPLLLGWFDVQNNSMFRDDHLICFHFNLLSC